MCGDALCDDCSGYEFGEGCEECVDNAVVNVDGVCECLDEYVYNAEFHVCSLVCHEACVTCDGTDDESCSNCADGYFM